MKMILAVAAALIAAAGAPASAAVAPVATTALAAAPFAAAQDRVVVRERTTMVRRNYNRPRWRARNVCRTTYRYGERRRVCRRVRYR